MAMSSLRKARVAHPFHKCGHMVRNDEKRKIMVLHGNASFSSQGSYLLLISLPVCWKKEQTLTEIMLHPCSSMFEQEERGRERS